jgi:DNA-binding transcriptional LysR family regulator
VLPPGPPDLLSLDLLDSIAELGSLGQAASRHGMSQPAVSMRMAQLERGLGLSLLQRSPAGTKLTPAGEQVAALGRRVLGEVHAMMTGVAALVAEEGSHLRVAASLTVAEYLLPGWLSALHRESPGVMLAVEVTNSSRVLERVREGRADVGFVEGHEMRCRAWPRSWCAAITWWWSWTPRIPGPGASRRSPGPSWPRPS